MDENANDKIYSSMKIPHQYRLDEIKPEKALQQEKKERTALSDGFFYEIEYDSYPIEGVGKFVLKPQKIEQPQKDEIKELFYSMRDISRRHRTDFGHNQFFDKRAQHDNAAIFYKQGVFMKDFVDSYAESAQFSSYFPNYQMLSYEQLRTYFTWRTKVREKTVCDASLSYAFLYIYELLNNIGTENPVDALDKLLYFWNAFRGYNKTIDKYVLRWIKDYHIYYVLPHSFKEFVEANNLSEHYAKMPNTDNDFELFSTISKYDIRKSAFFTDENKKLITACFEYVIETLRQVFSTNGIELDETVFSPTRKMVEWQPFKDALFHSPKKQSDRRIVLNENEIYICSQNKWQFSSIITSENGRKFIGYVMKLTESVLRKLLKYKFKLSCDINTVPDMILAKAKKSNLSLESIITSAVMEFYKEATKIVITVDKTALVKIRQDALTTQEKLIVEEYEPPVIFPKAEVTEQKPAPAADEPAYIADTWGSLKNALNETEVEALSVLTRNSDETNIKQFADDNHIMLEVLIDGINEKAMDFIGDNLIDEELIIYDDYIDSVKEMVNLA